MLSDWEYKSQIKSIIAEFSDGFGNIRAYWNDSKDARLVKVKISQVQKRLRLLKKDISMTIKSINSEYASEKNKIGKGLGAAVYGGLFGRKTLGKTNSAIREQIRQNQMRDTEKYRHVIQEIEEIIIKLDDIKIQIDADIIG